MGGEGWIEGEKERERVVWGGVGADQTQTSNERREGRAEAVRSTIRRSPPHTHT